MVRVPCPVLRKPGPAPRQLGHPALDRGESGRHGGFTRYGNHLKDLLAELNDEVWKDGAA